jgi:hypothetical protein
VVVATPAEDYFRGSCKTGILAKSLISLVRAESFELPTLWV